MGARPRSRTRPEAADGNGAPLLEARDLATAPESGGLRGVGLRVRRGEAVALFGPGARTVVAVLAGRVPLSGGAILLHGAEQPRGIGVGHSIGPAPARAGTRTVEEHLAGRARLRGGDPRSAAAVLDVFPMLRARARSPLGALTDGEHRLLGLAEALLSRPELLLIDGLTPGLAGPHLDALPVLVRRLLGAGAAAVIAEPVIPVALAAGTRACVLGDGRITAEFTAPRPASIAESLRAVRPPASGRAHDGTGREPAANPSDDKQEE
ncbi:ATP-binding cassette domain-containing protein [Spirillospora sp. NPDC047418]|jgi:ABC-type branched-subunit amino acid transport system ATPase component